MGAKITKALRIGIVGAGFSGTLLAVHLLRECKPDDRIHLIEKRSGFGGGLAYSTPNPEHLLNVRAANMSAFHDEPDHFVNWLQDRGEPQDGHGDAFVSRRLYGSYIRRLVCDAMWRGGKGRNLYLVADEVMAVIETDAGVWLMMAGGRSQCFDAVVLATGHLSPDDDHGVYFGDPWSVGATAGIPSTAPVLLIGTGLTMVDVVQSLLAEGHTGPIHAISRRGLLPEIHAPTRALTIDQSQLPRTTSALRLSRWLRGRIASAARDHEDWRTVVDGVRPHVQDLWRRLPPEERLRFVRHLRPWWISVRHRVAPRAAEVIDGACARGQLTVEAARVLDMEVDDAWATVTIRRRGETQEQTRAYARVINCSGPDTNYAAGRHPLIRDMVTRGLARPDPLALGLDVNEQGALINGKGIASRRLFALGPVTRGTFWEVVAVPDIRVHCARLATHLWETVEGQVGDYRRRA